ncbi:MAG TPA: N-6 DNA methylase [Verrucomicrobiae bacterium]|jgi:SAM-dependent methyltransferase
MASKRATQNHRPAIRYTIRKHRVAHLKEETVSNGVTSRAVQVGLNRFDGLNQMRDQSVGTATSVALHNALRRYGVEGEDAFLVLASRYLDTQKAACRNFSYFPVERGVAALNIVAHDKQVLSLLDGVVAGDPKGRELPTWYQFFLGRRFREGSGKFFTPRPIATAMTRLLPVHAEGTVLDPTCGGGTFLCEASHRWGDTRCHLIGSDVDRMLVGLTELVLALSAPPHHSLAFSCFNLYDADAELRNLRGRVHGILANPPFSLPLEKVAKPGELFGLGYRNSDALFLDVCLDLLAPGGNLVCLLPHSLVVNSEFDQLRRSVERHWELRGIVTLPEGVFYLTGNTTTRADIVHLQKKTGRHHQSHKAFFANAPTVGFPLNSRTTYFGENSLDLIAGDPRVLECTTAPA